MAILRIQIWFIIAISCTLILPALSFSRLVKHSTLLQYPDIAVAKFSDKLQPGSVYATTFYSPSALHAVEVEGDKDETKSHIVKSLGWAAAATGFAALVAIAKGQAAAVEFSSGYLLELCLSVDNLFAFLVLFEYFKVSPSAQEKILNYGILGALVLRGLFIGAGSVAISQFHDVLLIFAGVLAYSAFSIFFSKEDDEEEDISNNKVVQFAKKLLSTTDKYDGDNFFTVENGRKLATPLFLCLISVELTDIFFAFDSVPAIFGVTEDPFIVYSSNIFAIAGLRSLYSILSKAVSQLKYLDKAVGAILALIAAKLGAEFFDIELLDPLQSLLAVLSILSVGVVASLAFPSESTPSANE